MILPFAIKSGYIMTNTTGREVPTGKSMHFLELQKDLYNYWMTVESQGHEEQEVSLSFSSSSTKAGFHKEAGLTE